MTDRRGHPGRAVAVPGARGAGRRMGGSRPELSAGAELFTFMARPAARNTVEIGEESSLECIATEIGGSDMEPNGRPGSQIRGWARAEGPAFLAASRGIGGGWAAPMSRCRRRRVRAAAPEPQSLSSVSRSP
jgi:hypothetical protein